MALPPHRRSSFSYKTIDSRIRNVLDRRALLNNTVQVAMPFIKATTTIDLAQIGLGSGIGFTLGTQVLDRDFKIQDIYSSVGNSFVGYTYENGGTRNIYADKIEENLKLVETGPSLYNELRGLGGNFDTRTTNFNFIPPPGITSANVGYYKSGLLQQAQINFAVPSLSQLEFLHRTFLIPGCGMILEWGNQFAPKNKPEYVEGSLEPNMFPWYSAPGTVRSLLRRLGRNEVSIQEVLDEYVYDYDGQYMWCYGRIANFEINSNSDGSYECMVKIVGPSEESWAYSVRNTLVPSRDILGQNSVGILSSVEDYFTKIVEGEGSVTANFKNVLEAVRGYDRPNSSGPLSDWKGHVMFFRQGNKAPDGEAANENPSDSGASEINFGDSEDAYFMTWRFFVNVILNDEEYGLKGILKRSGVPQERLNKIAFLRPYEDINGNNPATDIQLLDPFENFVGYHRNLRTIDPGTLVIINDQAVPESVRAISTATGTDYNDNIIGPLAGLGPIVGDEIVSNDEEKLSDKGQFGALRYLGENLETLVKTDLITDRGFLSTGVWINHKAIVQSFASATTVLQGINNLLNRMSSATRNYWQLTIAESEPVEAGTSTSYTVVDANFKQSSQEAVDKFLNDVHTFNKYISKAPDSSLRGSDVIECKVNLNLPKLMFSQIATLGLVQPSDKNIADDFSQNSITSSPRRPDPDENLRRMFAITSIAVKDGNSSDLTNQLTPEEIADANARASREQRLAPNSETILNAQIRARIDGPLTNEQKAEKLDKIEQAEQELQTLDPIADSERINELEQKISEDKQYIRQSDKLVEEAAAAASVERFVNRYQRMRKILRYIEPFPDWMVNQITNSADDNVANAFGAAPGTLSISADIVLPGINGIRIGELFWIDRMPAFYKAFGAFQVLGLEQSIGLDGWVTKINARFNYLGFSWRSAMLEKRTLSG